MECGTAECGLARVWWAVALRGVLAIAFGILAILWPDMFWLAVVVTFAAYALVDGVFALVAAVRGDRDAGPRRALVLKGVVSIGAGVVAFAWPGITELVLLWVIAGWAITTGVLGIVASIRLRKEIRGEWVLALSGILSILLGAGLVLLPRTGLLVIAWWVAATSIVFGMVLLILAFRLRSAVQNLAPATADAHGMSRAPHPEITR